MFFQKFVYVQSREGFNKKFYTSNEAYTYIRGLYADLGVRAWIQA